MRRAIASVFLAVGMAAACDSTAKGSLLLDLGGEADALTRSPALTTLSVDLVDLDGGVTHAGSSPLPTTTIDLGKADPQTIASVVVTGTDGSGATRLRGTTLPFQLSATEKSVLHVFAQRTGELARLPGALPDDRADPAVAVVGGRYVFIAGGSGGSSEQGKKAFTYDFVFLEAKPLAGDLQRAPRSVVAFSTLVLLIDDTGATWTNLETGESQDAPAPAGATYADVAGGHTVLGATDVTYVVGATRDTGAATTAVLVVDASGKLSFAKLKRPRLGAAATYATSKGLVVVDGTTDTGDGGGAELLAPGAAEATELPLPRRGVHGAAAVEAPQNRVAVLGGVDGAGVAAPGVTLDPGCTGSCTFAADSAAFPAPATACEASPVGAGDYFVVGRIADGTSRSVRVTAAGIASVPMRIARSGARSLRSPTGSVLVVGGATTIESFIP